MCTETGKEEERMRLKKMYEARDGGREGGEIYKDDEGMGRTVWDMKR